MDEHERGSKPGVKALASSLLAIPRNYPLLWAIAWTTLLLGLCLAPNRMLPDEKSLSIKTYFPNADLAVHFTLFAGFVVNWIRIGRWPHRWVAIPAIGLLLAVGTECAQGLPIINRDPTLLDVLADSLGVVIGLVGSVIVGRVDTRPGRGQR